jgi:sugar phosphate isomerase/epimerase
MLNGLFARRVVNQSPQHPILLYLFVMRKEKYDIDLKTYHTRVLMKNKIGICEWYLATSGPSSVKTAGLLGFDGIQLSDLGGLTRNFPMTDKRLQEQYLENAQECGIELQAYYSPSLTDQGGIKYPLNSSEGKDALYCFTKGLEVCVSLRIPTILVASYDKSNFRNDYEMKNTAEMLKLFVQLAQEKGVQVAYECFATTERLTWILEYVGNGLKICYDTLNPIRFGFSNPPDEIRRLGIDILDHIHVKDAPEDMVGSCTLGEGYGKFFETINVLNELGYDGWYMVENYFYLPPMNQFGQGLDLAIKDLEILRKAVNGEQSK